MLDLDRAVPCITMKMGVNKDGQPQYNIVDPEFKKGGYIYSARSDTCNWLYI